MGVPRFTIQTGVPRFSPHIFTNTGVPRFLDVRFTIHTGVPRFMGVPWVSPKISSPHTGVPRFLVSLGVPRNVFTNTGTPRFLGVRPPHTGVPRFLGVLGCPPKYLHQYGYSPLPGCSIHHPYGCPPLLGCHVPLEYSSVRSHLHFHPPLRWGFSLGRIAGFIFRRGVRCAHSGYFSPRHESVLQRNSSPLM